MLANIVDHRTRRYRWKVVNAVIEPTRHDNGVSDSDQADEDARDLLCQSRVGISLNEAVAWAEGFEGKVTLYLYDDGDGVSSEADE